MKINLFFPTEKLDTGNMVYDGNDVEESQKIYWIMIFFPFF